MVSQNNTNELTELQIICLAEEADKHADAAKLEGIDWYKARDVYLVRSALSLSRHSEASKKLAVLEKAELKALREFHQFFYNHTEALFWDHGEEVITIYNAAAKAHRETQKVEHTIPPCLELRMAQDPACAYPDCVDRGVEGKCTKWLVGDCPGPSDELK